jgi:hypothetical protein
MYVEYYADQACTELLAEGPYDSTKFTSCQEYDSTTGSGFWSSQQGYCTTSSTIPMLADQEYVET